MSRLDLEHSAVVLSGLSYGILAALLYGILVRRTGDTTRRLLLLYSGLTLISLFAAHIPIMALKTGHFYFGASPLALIVLHNPTIQLAKLFGLGAVLIYGSVMCNEESSNVWDRRGLIAGCGGALLIIAGGLSKPSFNLVLLPAAGVLTLVEFFHGNRARAIWSLVFFLTPTAAILLAQWLYYYAGDTSIESRNVTALGVEPFYNFRGYRWAIPSIAVNVMFPLIVALTSLRDPSTREWKRFCGILLLFGLLWSGLLVELNVAGLPKGDSNFAWCLQTVMFIVFVLATTELVRITRFGQVSLVVRVAWGLFGLHVCCGIVWAYLQLSRPVSEFW